VIAAMPGEGCRYTLFNREFRTRSVDGQVATVVLADAAALGAVLRERFALELSEAELSALFR
jgi:arylamine N-acetyltransferase